MELVVSNLRRPTPTPKESVDLAIEQKEPHAKDTFSIGGLVHILVCARFAGFRARFAGFRARFAPSICHQHVLFVHQTTWYS